MLVSSNGLTWTCSDKPKAKVKIGGYDPVPAPLKFCNKYLILFNYLPFKAVVCLYCKNVIFESQALDIGPQYSAYECSTKPGFNTALISVEKFDMQHIQIGYV